MLIMLKIIKNTFLISLFFVLSNCDQASQSKNSSNSIVVVKVFSSLTCPHCADFHEKIYKKLRNEYVSTGKVEFKHNAFPLDLAALNAEKILQCKSNSQVNFKLLTEIYKKQNKWAATTDINIVNSSVKAIGSEYNLTENEMNNFLLDKNLEEKILNERIEAQKNYKISSTPTVYIDEKKYKGSRDYKSFKKAIDKLL